MSYYGLNVPLRALLMTLLFVTSNVALVSFIRAIKRKKIWHVKILLPAVAAVNAFFCVMLATEARAAKFARELPEIVRAVCEMPIIVCVLLLALSIGYLAFVYFSDLKFRRTHLSRASIKESLDKLPTGLCFYRENGRTVLVNHMMSNLCHKLVGRDLQNGKLFWEILSGTDALCGVERLELGSTPSFRLADGRVWTFSRTVLGDITQLVAADTTDLSNINVQLKAGNEELKAVNARLRAYGDKVEELTKTRERIEIKAGIHRELGQALLVTRRYLFDGSADASVPVALWEKNVAMLRREAELKSDTTPFDEFLESAAASGVTVEIRGSVPTDKAAEGLLVTAAVECLVNGVRHADANTLYITLTENGNERIFNFENDGAIPTGDIVEGTGLSSLRYGAKKLSGRMEVAVKPRFSLSIIIPKGKE